ncbi:MAG: hypothetical protein U0Y10_02230 [Spirosomataceae bacterium]
MKHTAAAAAQNKSKPAALTTRTNGATLPLSTYLILYNYLSPKIMKMYRYFIGIDVSKNELDVALVESNRVLLHLEVSNRKKGIEQVVK